MNSNIIKFPMNLIVPSISSFISECKKREISSVFLTAYDQKYFSDSNEVGITHSTPMSMGLILLSAFDKKENMIIQYEKRTHNSIGNSSKDELKRLILKKEEVETEMSKEFDVGSGFLKANIKFIISDTTIPHSKQIM